MKRLLTGVEALARGAAEEGVALLVAQRAPGLRGLAAAARREGVACDVAAGARLAVDLAAGASLAGARAVAAVADVFGAAESLQASVQAGLGGLVVVGVDDPGLAEGELCGDGRALARALDLPCLEPCDAAECGPHLAAALALSERWGTPVFVRLTVRVARTARPVELGAPRAATAAGLDGRAERHALTPPRAVAARARAEERLGQLAAEGVESPLNRLELRSTALGVVTSGASYGHVREALPEASVLKLGLSYPLPSELVRDFAGRVDRLVVIEESSPVIETELRALGLACRGRDLLPAAGELSPDLVRRAVLGGPPRPVEAPAISERHPEPCAGCPVRGVLLAAKRLHVTVVGDPGCAVLFSEPPLAPVDRALAAGASAALLQGAARALGERVRGRQVALVGAADACGEALPALGHLAASGLPATVVVAEDGDGPSRRDVAAVARALGAQRAEVVDAFDVGSVEAALRAALPERGLSVVVARGRCPVATPAPHGRLEVTEARCNRCGACLRVGCPAISDAFEAMTIDAGLCQGCGVCAQACRTGAIAPAEERP